MLIKVISGILKSQFPVPLLGIFIGLAFSFFIGIASGLYPAIKASKIDPIKAIFYFD
jgi:putative ABC transport system permease protein